MIGRVATDTRKTIRRTDVTKLMSQRTQHFLVGDQIGIAIKGIKRTIRQISAILLWFLKMQLLAILVMIGHVITDIKRTTQPIDVKK